ncbi:hypothetical protein KC902_04590 [Candidatus Kaiserbacteria bacterium]|nr:hypothetical protein [Candidatus Kaiserbacteria bacterium]USN89192.1 MAG: hypothetical protein H6780_02130 [Candidatus Nomurabacteria bacterium]
MKTITNILITHALFLALFAGAAYALAEEETSSPTDRRAEMQATIAERKAEFASTTEAKRAEFQENMDERREEMENKRAEIASSTDAKRAEIKERVEERRTELQERAQERITNLAANMSNRMDAVIGRLNNIIDRLETRISKLTEAGIDTEEANAALASAKLSVDAAAQLIANIDTAVADAVGAEDARAGWAETKAQYTAIRDHIKTAHTELRNTVAALKAAISAAGYGAGSSEAVRMRMSEDETSTVPESNATEEENDTPEAAS